MKPICVMRLLSRPRSHVPKSANGRHIGAIRMIASASDQLSYSAEWTRNTKRTQSGKMKTAVLPASFAW